MVSSILSNIAAYSAQSNISNASSKAASSIARLSSGKRIVKASDDVSGLAVGTALGSQVSTLKAALNNASQGSSLLQVADGGLSQITDILQRQASIASQASSGSLTDANRAYLDQEFQALSLQIDQIANTTNFNGVNLLGGGLGNTTILASSAAIAATYTPNTAGQSNGTAAVASTSPLQAFNTQTGASAAGTAAGQLNITDSTGALLTTGYDTVNKALVGQFSSFVFSNVTYGAAAAGSATLTATINGVQFTGAAQGAATSVTLNNGSSYIKIGTAALSFANANATQLSATTLTNSFANVAIQATQSIQGVDFTGTRLAGAIGSANYGTAGTRLTSLNASISNFAYAGNTGAANTSQITVQVNGQTFTASGVKDALAAGTINFTSADNQTLVVDLTGLTTAFTNIRTSSTDQTALINALNQGFARAGGGLQFNVGSTASATVGVSLASASTSNLFRGQALSVGSSAGAVAAQNVVAGALTTVTALRSTVGALESRFNFISANLQTSIQNQDSARSALLDTDVSAESTAYASAQVQTQAGIAVLAQANQLPQNLLKLIQ